MCFPFAIHFKFTYSQRSLSFPYLCCWSWCSSKVAAWRPSPRLYRSSSRAEAASPCVPLPSSHRAKTNGAAVASPVPKGWALPSAALVLVVRDDYYCTSSKASSVTFPTGSAVMWRSVAKPHLVFKKTLRTYMKIIPNFVVVEVVPVWRRSSGASNLLV